MLFKSLKIPNSDITLELKTENGLPEIQLKTGNMSFIMGNQGSLTPDDIKLLGKELISFSDFLGGIENEKTENLIFIDIGDKNYVKTLNPLTTTTEVDDARRFKLHDIENIDIDNFVAFIRIQFYGRQIGNCDKFFDVVNGSLIYTTIQKEVLDKFGISEKLKNEILGYNNGDWQWIVRSCPITRYIEVYKNENS